MTSNKLPDFEKNFSDWYNEIVFQAELVDHAPVRGCMVIRPYGYALWENIRDILDKKIKCDELELFDNYVVLYYDPQNNSTELTKKDIEKLK